MTDQENTQQPAPAAEEEPRSAGQNTPRKVGVARFFELMGRDLWPFYKASILCCLGFVPVFLVIMFGILAKAVWISVLGGLVANPVLAVPTSVGYGASMNGLSALLTMINSCANGIAVLNIDNGYGAGYMATQINRLAERNGKEKE